MAEQPIRETVLVTKSKAGHGAALTQVTMASSHVVIDIPAGKGGILHAVSISMTFVGTTILNAGGAIRLTNTMADWDPFYLPTGVWTVIAPGGNALKPFTFNCFKKLPGKSQVHIDYIPYDDTISQYLEIILHWILTEADPVVETFVDILHPLEADTVTGAKVRGQITTSWAHNAGDVIPIPQNKGGTLKAIIIQPWVLLTTIIRGGGRFQLECDAHDITPNELYTTMLSCIDDGGNAYNPMVVPSHHEVKPTSNYIGYYTPSTGGEQSCTFGLVWERPYQPKQ